MVILGAWHGKPIAISVKPNCLTISVDEPVEADVVSYDNAGRLWTAYFDTISYRRGLDGKIIAKWRAPGEQRTRRWLAAAEVETLIRRANHLASSLVQAIQSGEAVLNTSLPHEGLLVLERAAHFDNAASLRDIQKYQQVYSPVGILPPDQYMAVVLQATIGCSFNTCTFCDFYKGRRFTIKTPEEFHQHARDVKDFLGDGLSLRRTIFLGDANSLVVPTTRLLALFDVVHDVYDVAAMGGIYAFLDGFSGEKKTVEDFRQFRSRGLERIYIGMESGNADLLRFLKKPGNPADVIRSVHAMKSAGVAVGVIILLGAGGSQFAERHIRDTIAAVNAMKLDLHDIVYFSELIVAEEMAYAQDAFEAGLQPLNHSERLAQGEMIESGFRFSQHGGTPHISRYDIREFVY
jgi:hypothetical protein